MSNSRLERWMQLVEFTRPHTIIGTSLAVIVFYLHAAAATGRHFALVATKPEEGDTASRVVEDRRSQTAKADTHLKTWEAKKEAGR